MTFDEFAAGVLVRAGVAWRAYRTHDGRQVWRFTQGPATCTLLGPQGPASLRATLYAAFKDPDSSDAIRSVLGPAAWSEITTGRHQ